jgi:hypothetical protein
MKNLRSARESFSNILDDFLKKSINIILNSRMTKLSEKDQAYDTKVISFKIISFSHLKT